MVSLGRVLVVDDEAYVANLLLEALREFGYTVEVAGTGEEALRVLPVFRPDAILLDLWMPGMRGEEVFAIVQRDHPGLPVVIVTADRDLETARGLLRGGAFDYVPKPFDLAVLERVVAAAVASRRDPGGT